MSLNKRRIKTEQNPNHVVIMFDSLNLVVFPQRLFLEILTSREPHTQGEAIKIINLGAVSCPPFG